MKVWIFLHTVFVHISIICSMTLITAQILDWYNPFMDFFGHSVVVLYALYVSTLMAGLIFLAIGKIKRRKV